MKYDFWIVAIGCSAGGLIPLKKTIKNLVGNARAAFIIIPHLLPTGKSNLDFILSKISVMPAIKTTHGMALEPRNIYILPENKVMTMQNGYFILRDRRADEIVNNAIDIFFRSLALDAKEKAIGIVLSGGGNDGLLGAKEIEKNKGLIIVQDPQTAEHPYMPNAIIESDKPNAILSPEQISRKIIQWTGLI